MSDTPKPPVLDAFGLEKIPLHGGKDEATDRDFSRAPITSGGTITGKAFQTNNVDPRITFDSTAMICHNQAGQATFKIDIATGVVSLLFGSGVAALLRWVDTSDVAQADIGFVTTLGGFTVESLNAVFVIAPSALGSAASPYSFLELVNNGGAGSPEASIQVSGSGNGRIQTQANVGFNVIDLFVSTAGGSTCELKLNAAAASTSFLIVPGATSRFRIDNLVTGTAPVDFINGQIVMSGGASGEQDIICALAAFTTVVGVRWTAAGAGSVGGQFDHYRQVRGSTAGARVTPAGAAYTPATAVNVAAATIITILDVGAFFAVSATAAGNVVAVGSVIYS